jgi:hypothetical protein
MRGLLTSYAIPVAAVVIGILGGVLPPPTLPVLWVVGILDALLAAWYLVYVYGRGRAIVYAVIAVVFSFSAEYALISIGLLTHLTAPQIAGVAALNLLQDFFAVASPYIFACALLPCGGVLARAFAAAVIMLVTTLVGGPFASTLGYYIYNAPFLAWGESLGLARVPRLPWAEPIGMFVLAFATTIAFAVCSQGKGERRWASPKWAALLYFNGQALPGWAWAAYTQRWELFAVCTVPLVGLAIFALRAVNAAERMKQTTIEADGQSMS